MPSLKDLRNRIASVKSTQKITKAMQMVAVSKLRRAQSAVEAARPYAEQVEAVLTNLAGAATDGQGPRLLVGSGSDQVHLLVVCTGERGLCGAFNTAIVRLARDKANALAGEGKTVKILCVGKKGYDQLRRTHEKQILEMIDLRAVRTISYETAQPIAAKVIELFDNGEFDVCTLFYSRFKSVIAQIPTAQQLIPPELGSKGREGAGLRLRAGRGRNPRPAAAARGHGAHLPRAARERGLVLRRADERDGQRHPQRRRHGEEVHASLQSHPPGDDHQGTDRDHFGRRGALTRPVAYAARQTEERGRTKWRISRMPPAASPR